MLRYLLEKEFKQFFRNTFLPKMVIFMPLVVILLFPLIANFEIKNINLCIIDNDKSSKSNRLVQKIGSTGYFIIKEVVDNYDNALKTIENNNTDMVIEIPSGFEKDIDQLKPARLLIAINAVNGIKGGLGSSYLMNILKDFNIEMTFVNNINSGIKETYFEIIPRYWYNPYLKYNVLMIPALMIMVLAIVTGFLPAINIVGEKESGTIEQMNVTPVKKLPFVLSKLIPYWTAGYVALTISIITAQLVYGFSPKGSYFTVYIFASLFMFAFSGFGLIISNYAKTMQQAIFMILFFLLTFIFLSGFYTPLQNMPKWGQVFSNFSPFKYIIQVLRMIYLKGNGFADMIPHFLALCGFVVFFNGWAVISYRKKID